MFGIPQHSFYVMALVLALLCIGTLVCWFKQVKHPDKDYTELSQRITSWWWIIGLVFFVLILSKNTAIAFFGFVSFLALKEFLSIIPTRLADRRVILWAYIAIPLQYLWVGYEWYGMFLIFIPVYVFLFLPMRMVLLGDTKGFIHSAGVIHWAMMLTVLCISHIAYLLVLPVKNPEAGHIGLILFLLFMTQLNDVSQYVWGKSLGKHKIVPKVSPNKTWEGFIGGVVTISLMSALIAPFLTPFSHAQGLLAGALIAFSGFVGDLVISSVKRDLQIKDSGTLIPGHGGVLDRLDSLTFTSPLFFHLLYYLHY
ncbi:putative Phosphatidate cytidylyltransferase [Vibrio nigripulchritudo SO65]|uniref:phosphatidate cytidylyltransferase n=1 Tax=Vibrio nigripulchritudo TaxID=28173 RepID=UPI0003B1A061|nr:phosphatidate cytidylyltransferase [Vibrio nigripulchritudo]CCN34690.1 putative Phosphatidate cytidylyltransferase [Vibrio nigripulchritudo AM115]CCN39809.1 putative Phosphatidate cytidylyltransferase [Vibrio nigripulchritudo FTn2]CCN67709.1 putative Phosphatidate cytidylyltransferase [Vibrio nigripulchritudo POn4]CCN77861.1 putative Phosphatidate cytidylyltransferase [Vibrio nigripulchritudo SO65]